MISVKELRKLTGMTQVQFADKFSIPVNTIRSWEADKMSIKHRECPSYLFSLLCNSCGYDQDGNEKNGITYDELKKSLNDYDKYGNFIGFDDAIMSDLSGKAILSKYLTQIITNIEWFLCLYHTGNESVAFLYAEKRRIDEEIALLLPVLEDLVTKDINGMDELLNAVFGASVKYKDYLQLYREYISL